jgi:hypothetical protein
MPAADDQLNKPRDGSRSDERDHQGPCSRSTQPPVNLWIQITRDTDFEGQSEIYFERSDELLLKVQVLDRPRQHEPPHYGAQEGNEREQRAHTCASEISASSHVALAVAAFCLSGSPSSCPSSLYRRCSPLGPNNRKFAPRWGHLNLHPRLHNRSNAGVGSSGYRAMKSPPALHSNLERHCQ